MSCGSGSGVCGRMQSWSQEQREQRECGENREATEQSGHGQAPTTIEHRSRENVEPVEVQDSAKSEAGPANRLGNREEMNLCATKTLSAVCLATASEGRPYIRNLV